MTVRTIRISIAAFYAVWKIDGRDMLSRLRCCGHFTARLGEPGVAEHGRDNEAHTSRIDDDADRAVYGHDAYKRAAENDRSVISIDRHECGRHDCHLSVAESSARPYA